VTKSLQTPTLSIARVEPLTRTRAVRGPFDYRLGPEHAGVEVGSVLSVSFGNRRTLGVVLALADSSEIPPDRLATPIGVIAPPLPPDLVELAGWMAREYCSTTARALSLLLAPGAAAGVRPRTVRVAEITASGRGALGDPAVRLSDGQREALQQLERAGALPATGLGLAVLRRLEARGLVVLEHRERARHPAPRDVGKASAPPILSLEQESALRPVLGALADRRPERFLLHGVTGSGKTEVYLQAVAATLAAGRGAIVLVPEIALTPQTLGRFRARFGDTIAVLHSALGRGERYDEWLRLSRGDARVCVGPRSAVFAPLPDIGLIVIDEEHEASYKHEGDPRYDARMVAERRSVAHSAVLLAGSATPRPESFGQMARLRLTERVDGRPLPPVEILDMREKSHPLHPETRAALAEVRRAGGKAIVLLNRRGWSNFLSCRSCGRVWTCPQCDVALVLHLALGTVSCHHCGHRERVPERCPDCGSTTLARHGAGTERLEHVLFEALGEPGFPIFRLDADVVAAKDGAGITLERFDAAPAGLLVGTQMVAKGHDFPEVTLGVVLDADQTLRFPDFRAEERTFSLVTQLAGRAGRGDAGGRVLVQTLAPDARAIKFAARHDAEGFLAGELARRRALGYPPFSSLIRVVCSSPEAASAHAAAVELRALITPPNAQILGPAPLFRLRGRARSQLVVKAFDRAPAIAAVGSAVDALTARRAKDGVNVSVDVDPQ
jgi:primosomal protein N' (replication factor Y) (superfamily II helicase)